VARGFREPWEAMGNSRKIMNFWREKKSLKFPTKKKTSIAFGWSSSPTHTFANGKIQEYDLPGGSKPQGVSIQVFYFPKFLPKKITKPFKATFSEGH